MIKKIGKMLVHVSEEDAFLQKNSISESDAEMDRRAKAAVRSAIDKAKVCKKPIAKYDVATRRAYIEYADGEKKYVN